MALVNELERQLQRKVCVCVGGGGGYTGVFFRPERARA